MHQLMAFAVWITLLNIQDSTVYSGPRPLFRELRKFLKGSVFTNIEKSLIMRDSQPKNIKLTHLANRIVSSFQNV